MKLTMRLGERSYDIVLKRGALANLGQLANLARKVFIVTDSGVPPEYAAAVKAQCAEGVIYTVPQGESSKSLKTYEALLCAMLEDQCGITGVTRQEIHTGVIGINHFTWLNSATYQGMDLFPMYRKFAEKYHDSGFTKGMDDNWMNNSFACSHKVKFDLFLRYGLIAAAGDRHLVEFLPPWYLKDPETVREWGFGLTTVAWRKNDLKERLARRARLLSGEEELDMKGSGEEGHLLIKALLGLGEMVSNVNIPNRGQISNLPLNAVVETNALFRRDSIAPIHAGSLPMGIDALVTRQVLNQEATVRAALTCDRQLALNTLMNDPQMGHVSLQDGKKLLDDLLEAQRKFLPKEWFA